MQPQERAALDALAHYYDLRHGAAGADVEFYAELAEESAGTVIEVGCGTGRLLLPLAEAGHTVFGVDVSRQMLLRARRRLAGFDSAARVRLLQGDVRQLPVRDARLAVMALNTFCHFTRPEEQHEALTSVRGALSPGGILALDVPNPHAEFDARPDGVPTLEAVHESEDTTVYEWSVTEADAAAQTMSVRLIYDACDASGAMRRQSHAYLLRLFYRYELELLLRGAGFGEVQLFGDFDGCEYETGSPRIVAVARA
ncbi:MAG: class I SAM-dependent methyltransferase [Anaerolineae bacterium]